MYLVTQELAAHLDPISRLLQSPRWADCPRFIHTHTIHGERSSSLVVSGQSVPRPEEQQSAQVYDCLVNNVQ